MKIDEAIKRFIDNAEYERSHGNLQGCLEFIQLAEWLVELKHLREQTDPCGDIISRRAAVSVANSFDATIVVRGLEKLPSVQPEQKTYEDVVSRQAVLDINTQYHGKMPNELNHRIWKDIKALPPVQPEPKVVRCKDCKYVWKEDGWDNLYCNRVKVSGSFAVERDGFCAWGETEEGE